MVGIRFNGFNAWRGLERIGRIDDQNPVPMTKQRHGFSNFGFPIRRWRWSGEDAVRGHQQAESDEKLVHPAMILPEARRGAGEGLA
jgi:hypothetical protein